MTDTTRGLEQAAKKRGFAAMTAEQRRQIASAGGIARREAYKTARRNAHLKAAGARPAAAPINPA
jgi:hypothetical protein